MKSPQFALHAQMEESHWWFLARRKIATELIHRVVPPSRGKRVVDIGCGTGGNIASLMEDYSCVGIDPSAEAIEQARSRFPEARFICGSIPEDLGEAGSTASLLLLMDVLEHAPDDFRLFSELLSNIRPGSYLLLTVPADMSLWSEHDVSFGHYRRYDRSRLEMLWKNLPVSSCLVSHYNTRLYPLVRGLRTWSRWRGGPTGQAGTDFAMPSQPINLLLTKIFSSEARVLAETLQGKRTRGFPYGVSLIAVLRREIGEIRPQTRPPHLPPDPHQPEGNHA